MIDRDGGNAPIVERRLVWNAKEDLHDVVVLIYRARADGDDCVCVMQIDGLPAPIRTTVYGVDSLQAVINAMSAARAALAPYIDLLSFCEQPRQHGFPLIVPLIDPDEDRYIEQIVTRELQHFVDITGRADAKRASRLAESYGLPPFDAPQSVSTEQLHVMLSAMSEGDPRLATDATYASAFALRREAILNELRKRATLAEKP